MKTPTLLAALLLFPLAPVAGRAVTQGFSNREAVQVGDSLAAELGIRSDKRELIRARVQAWMNEEREREFAGIPISGVLAYELGKGGLVVEVTKGDGLLRKHGENRNHPLKIKGVTAGANVGGASEVGIGVVLGPDASKQNIDGKYKVSQLAATAGGASTNIAELTKRKSEPGPTYRVILIGTATGLAAMAGLGEIKLEVE